MLAPEPEPPGPLDEAPGLDEEEPDAEEEPSEGLLSEAFTSDLAGEPAVLRSPRLSVL